MSGAGYWLDPDTGRCVKVETTHDEWIRVAENARSMGVPQAIYAEIMKYPPTAVDQIRLLAIHAGLVRMREHPRYLSVQFAAEGSRVASVLKAIVAALGDLKIHPDTRLEMDNLLLGESTAMTVAEMRIRIANGQPVFLGRSGGKPHPFLTEIQERFGERAGEDGGGGAAGLTTSCPATGRRRGRQSLPALTEAKVAKKRQKQNHLPVLLGLSGIRVIEPTLYLYVADCPVDKDHDCSVVIEKPESENQKWLIGQDGGRSNARNAMRGSKGPEQEAVQSAVTDSWRSGKLRPQKRSRRR